MKNLNNHTFHTTAQLPQNGVKKQIWLGRTLCLLLVLPILTLATSGNAVSARPLASIDSVEPVNPVSPPLPDSCKLLGELIHQNKDETSNPGNYAQRPDVKAFAHRIALCYNLDEAWVLATLGKAKYQASTVKFIMPQPAGERNWQKFRASFLQADRIQGGVKFWQAHQKWLELAEKTYGVPPPIILSILGAETSFGKVTGNFRIVDALSTLAFDFPKERSDRTDYFAGELAQYLVFAAQQRIDPMSIKGSYAGAIGIPQFMPSNIMLYGVDFDRDGKIDLHNSVPDVIGSVANYLAAHGWQAGLPASFGVTLQNTATPENIKLLCEPDITPTFTAHNLATHGVLVNLGSKANQLQHEKLSFILLPNGGNAKPDYVAGTQNFFVITRYNRSSFYAMVIIDLADAIATAHAKATAIATQPGLQHNVQPPSKIAVP